MNIWHILWEAGLVVKLVMLILLALSIVSWAIFLQKRKLFKKVRGDTARFLQYYHTTQNLNEILEQAYEMPHTPLGGMFERGYEQLKKMTPGSGSLSANEAKKRLQKHFAVFGFGVVERALKQAMNERVQQLESMNSLLASIGSLAPFIGLFGTVWGIIHSFSGFASGGTSLEAVAPGIAEALVATAIGLAAAIPAVWFYNYFSSEIEKLTSQMESFSEEFLNMVERSIMDG